VIAGVAVAHVVALGLLLLTQPRLVPPLPPVVIDVELIPLTPPPEPPRPASAEAGGGAPATASNLHVPPEVRETPDPLPVPPPPTPAPEPTAVLGAAPESGPTAGLGQGGEGTGTGSGVGAGSGPGSGAGRATLISGPSRSQIRDAQPRTGLAVRVVGRAEMRCRIRLDQRLEGCSVTSETPPGSRLGRALLALAPSYRWRPPTDSYGRAQDNTEIVVGLNFDP